MGPRPKPFLEVTQRQRQLRVRALSQVHIESIRTAKAVKNALCCIDCTAERERFQNVIISKLSSVLELVRGISNRAVDEGNNVHRGNYALLPPMPFEDVDALQRFDRDLEDEQFRDQFKNKIKDIGGKTAQKAVKFAMEVVMTDELTKRVVWSQGAEAMLKISNFRFPSIINDVVRDNFEGAKKKEIENRIADWLRRGGNRMKAAAVAAAKLRLQQPQ